LEGWRAEEVAAQGPKWPNYRKEKKNIVLRRHGNFVEKDEYRSDGIALSVPFCFIKWSK
jgi:hypothetical protein